MKIEDLFVVEEKGFILDQDGVYYGHSLLEYVYNYHHKRFEEQLDSLPDNDSKLIIKKLFFEAFNKRYFEAQQSLADKFLKGKIVSVSGGIVKGHANPDEMYVYWVGCTNWFETEKNPGTILVLSYGDDCIARILINMETTIKIIGKI